MRTSSLIAPFLTLVLLTASANAGFGDFLSSISSAASQAATTAAQSAVDSAVSTIASSSNISATNASALNLTISNVLDSTNVSVTPKQASALTTQLKTNLLQSLVQSAVQNQLASLQNSAAVNASDLTSQASGVTNLVSSLLNGVGAGGVVNSVTDTASSLAGSADSVINTAQDAVSNPASAIEGAANNVNLGNIINSASSVINTATSVASSAGGAINTASETLSTVGNIAGGAGNVLSSIGLGSVGDVLKSSADVAKASGDITSSILKSVNSGNIDQVFSNTASTLSDYYGTALNAKDAVTGQFDNIKNIYGLIDNAYGTVSGVVDSNTAQQIFNQLDLQNKLSVGSLMGLLNSPGDLLNLLKDNGGVVGDLQGYIKQLQDMSQASEGVEAQPYVANTGAKRDYTVLYVCLSLLSVVSLVVSFFVYRAIRYVKGRKEPAKFVPAKEAEVDSAMIASVDSLNNLKAGDNEVREKKLSIFSEKNSNRKGLMANDIEGKQWQG